MRDLASLIHPVVAIAPTTITDNSVITGLIVDLSGYQSCVFLIAMGVLAANAATFAVTMDHGDDAALADAAAVPATGMTGTLALAGFDQSADLKTRKIGYAGSKRYVRLKITPAGNNAAAPITAIALLGDSRFAPTPNPPG